MSENKFSLDAFRIGDLLYEILNPPAKTLGHELDQWLINKFNKARENDRESNIQQHVRNIIEKFHPEGPPDYTSKRQRKEVLDVVEALQDVDPENNLISCLWYSVYERIKNHQFDHLELLKEALNRLTNNDIVAIITYLLDSDLISPLNVKRHLIIESNQVKETYFERLEKYHVLRKLSFRENFSAIIKKHSNILLLHCMIAFFALIGLILFLFYVTQGFNLHNNWEYLVITTIFSFMIMISIFVSIWLNLEKILNHNKYSIFHAEKYKLTITGLEIKKLLESDILYQK